MEENSQLEKKSLRQVTKNNPDWEELAKDCVSFANALGGVIKIGIEDDDYLPPDNQIIPSDLAAVIKKQIESRTVNVGIEVNVRSADNDWEYIDLLIKPNINSIASTSKGKYYKRIGDECKPILPDELLNLINDKSAYQWELQQNMKIPKDQYDKDKFNKFVDNIRESDRVTDFVKYKSPDELLEHYLLANGEFLTNLGILWVGKREDRARLSYSPTIQYIKYNELEQKVNKIVWDDYSLNPKELIQDVFAQIKEFQESIEYPDGVFRKKIYNYDEVVLRELIVNAIAHRPYTIRGDIFINLYIDRLEVHNPGLLPLGVTPKNILHTSVQRNPHLSKIFYDLGLMEKEGSGYDKMYEILLSSGKNAPIVEEDCDRVIVSINKNIVNKAVINFIDKISKEYQLKSKELISLGFIAMHNALTLRELSELIGKEEQNVVRDWISSLLDKKIIKSKGKTNAISYFVEPELLRKMQFKGRTNLKTIQPHRLQELIREDLKRYPNSSRKDIHQRIGKEIPERTLRAEIKKLIDKNIIKKFGNTSNTKYLLT